MRALLRRFDALLMAHAQLDARTRSKAQQLVQARYFERSLSAMIRRLDRESTLVQIELLAQDLERRKTRNRHFPKAL
jgi:chemotaxis receptor (MCP) glutamine deamidase CheD